MLQESNNPTIESIKIDVKRIYRAGYHAEIFGWILLLLASAIIWFIQTLTTMFPWFGIFFLAGLFFVYTGKYIKDGRGRYVKTALLANAIVAFPLCSAILPIYICIQSANNYSRFKQLPDKIRELYNKRKPFRLNLFEAVLLGCVIIIGAVSVGLRIKYLNDAHHTNKTTIRVATIDTVSKSHFTIAFPASTNATDLTEQVSGHGISYTAYTSTTNNGMGEFDVYAYNYPAAYFNYASMPAPALSGIVHKSLISILQGRQSSLVSSRPSMYAGHPSEDAMFTSQTFSGQTTGYIRVFFINDYEYAIMAVQSSLDSFNKFANSFQIK